MNSQRMADKVILVTGAGSGIGRAAALRMATEGGTVFVTDVNEDAARDATGQIAGAAGAGRAEAAVLDVADEAAWQHVLGHVLATSGRLDVLVNNAGISFAAPIAETPLDKWRRVMAVNLEGVFLGTKHGIAAMPQGGSIVNVSSVAGIRPHGGAAAYGSSKAAVRLLSKTAAIECADAGCGVRVNLVSPGGVKTPMWEKETFFQALIDEHGGTEEAFAAMAGESGSHQFYSAEDIAETILYLSSDDAAHLNGAEIVLDHGHAG